MDASQQARVIKEISALLTLSRERLRQSDFAGAQQAARKAIQLKNQLAGTAPSQPAAKPVTAVLSPERRKT
jgi:hypothetical protein